jgi:hypothetical protein
MRDARPGAVNAEGIANALGNSRRNGAGWLCRCPVEDHKKSPRPLSIRKGDLAGIIVYCFAGCSRVDVLRALRERGLLDDSDGRPRKWNPRVTPTLENKPPDRDKPRWLFEKALPLKGSPAASYLIDARGCSVLPSHNAVRFLPAMPPLFPWPSMVSLVTDFADANRVLTLHFTYLMPDGSGKAPTIPNKRTMKGYPVKRGVLRLIDAAEVTTRLGIAEGIETALAVMSAFRRDEGRIEHVWCALNAGNMGDLPVVPGIETLAIYADRGKAGEQAADKLEQRWLAAGREVEIYVAPADDFNPTAAT